MSFFKTKKTNKNIDLILAASGARAPCFIGAIEALHEKGYNIHRIAGTSGGSIIASGYALGMSMKEMREMAPATPYSDFKDFKVKNLLSITNPSVYTGQELDRFYKDVFGKAKMKDFKIDCRIRVTKIIGKEIVIITKDSHPDLLVWKAVRMSSTVPFIFPYLRLDGHPVTDGALYTQIFDIFPENERPLICIRPRADVGILRRVQTVKISKLFLWNYLKIVAEFFSDSVDNQHIPEEEWDKTVIVPTFELGGFNFELGANEIKRLMQYGYNAAIISDIVPYIKD